MVKIRLTRTGKKGEAYYRIIVVRAREKRDTKAIEQLGFYNPRSNPSVFEIDKDRVKYWLGVGAQPTYTVARFLEKQGLYKSYKKKFTDKAGKKKQARLAEAAAEKEAGPKPEAAKPEAPVTESKTSEAEVKKPESAPAEAPKTEEKTA